MVESGGPFRPLRGAPGLLGQVLCRLFYHPDQRLEPVAIDQRLTAGETLPIAGGIEVIHTPGHCAGQVALLWHPGRMLFAGDVGANLMGLGDPVGFECLQKVVPASANWSLFHSMLPGSATASLSSEMRRRVSETSGARNRRLDTRYAALNLRGRCRTSYSLAKSWSPPERH